MHALCPVGEGGHSYPYFTSFYKTGFTPSLGQSRPEKSSRTLLSEAPSPEIFDWAELGTRAKEPHDDREFGNP